MDLGELSQFLLQNGFTWVIIAFRPRPLQMAETKTSHLNLTSLNMKIHRFREFKSLLDKIMSDGRADLTLPLVMINSL